MVLIMMSIVVFRITVAAAVKEDMSCVPDHKKRRVPNKPRQYFVCYNVKFVVQECPPCTGSFHSSLSPSVFLSDIVTCTHLGKQCFKAILSRLFSLVLAAAFYPLLSILSCGKLSTYPNVIPSMLIINMQK